MTKERRQQIMLASLVAILLVVGGRMFSGTFGENGPGGVSSTGQRESGKGTSIEPVLELRVADLELAPDTYELGRDPFRFAQARRQPTPSKPPPLQTPEPKATPVRSVPPVRAPAGPQPPPVDVVYLGRFGTTNRPIAVFSDGREIFNVFEGGVVKDNFVVDKIGYESADLKFVGFPDTPSQRLAVGG
jgi:hypothetical protein